MRQPVDSDYCQLEIPPAANPCQVKHPPNPRRLSGRFQYQMGCTNIPGMNVVWADNLKSDGGPWSGCTSRCCSGINLYGKLCGLVTVDTTPGRACGAATFCALTSMPASVLPIPCP